MTSRIDHLLNRALEVWRPGTTSDGAGGQQVTYTQRPYDVRAKVDQPSTADRTLAQQAGSRHTHTIYLPAGADVARGDQLRGDGQTFRVLATMQPSRPDYLKADCELIEREGA